MRYSVSVILVCILVVFSLTAGCAGDINVQKKVGDFGSTFGASAEEQNAISWFTQKYGDPRVNSGQPPQFIEPLITSGLTANQMPVNKITVFPVNGGSVYFWVFYQQFKKGTPITVTWTYMENGNVVSTVNQQTGDTYGRLVVEFQKPDSGWGKGRQRITVSGSGATATVDFTIGDSMQTVPLPYSDTGATTTSQPVAVTTQPVAVTTVTTTAVTSGGSSNVGWITVTSGKSVLSQGESTMITGQITGYKTSSVNFTIYKIPGTTDDEMEYNLKSGNFGEPGVSKPLPVANDGTFQTPFYGRTNTVGYWMLKFYLPNGVYTNIGILVEPDATVTTTVTPTKTATPTSTPVSVSTTTVIPTKTATPTSTPVSVSTTPSAPANAPSWVLKDVTYNYKSQLGSQLGTKDKPVDVQCYTTWGELSSTLSGTGTAESTKINKCNKNGDWRSVVTWNVPPQTLTPGGTFDVSGTLTRLEYNPYYSQSDGLSVYTIRDGKGLRSAEFVSVYSNRLDGPDPTSLTRGATATVSATLDVPKATTKLWSLRFETNAGNVDYNYVPQS